MKITSEPFTVTRPVTASVYAPFMPVYHFTFHAYGTWLPDRDEGYVRRGRGVLPTDERRAADYRARMVAAAATFGMAQQAAIFDELVKGQALQDYRLLAVAMEPTHLHAVLSWIVDRDAKRFRGRVKASLTRGLNKRFGKRQWFVANASQKRVVEPEHLEHLRHVYLPSHHGLFWREGMVAPRVSRAE